MASNDFDDLLLALERKATLISEQIALTKRLKSLESKHARASLKSKRPPPITLRMMSDDEALRNIAANVSRLMDAHSLSLSKIARICSTSEKTTYAGGIRDIREGIHMPGAGLLARVATALGVTAHDLLNPPIETSPR